MNGYASSPQVAGVIRKWYDTLDFPRRFDKEFEMALGSIPISPETAIETYDLSSADGRRNLLSFLYFCERASRDYAERGIPRQILLDTLQDIVRWTESWSEVKGELYLGELPWLQRHMHLRLFKVGRLQFYMAPSPYDIPQFGIRKGSHVVELHIPRGEKLTPEAVTDSLRCGKAFLQTYFPEYDYEYFLCLSWLLDETLRKYLPEGSNILRFGKRFCIVGGQENDALLRFLFRWDTTAKTLAEEKCTTGFQRRIQQAVAEGETFRVMLGVLRADDGENFLP